MCFVQVKLSGAHKHAIIKIQSVINHKQCCRCVCGCVWYIANFVFCGEAKNDIVVCLCLKKYFHLHVSQTEKKHGCKGRMAFLTCTLVHVSQMQMQCVVSIFLL